MFSAAPIRYGSTPMLISRVIARAGVVGVQRAEHQVAGERRLNRGAGGFLVADFADHDHVGVLPQQRAQGLGERQPDLLLHLELVDQRQVVFDRVFDRADVVLHRAMSFSAA